MLRSALSYHKLSINALSAKINTLIGKRKSLRFTRSLVYPDTGY